MALAERMVHRQGDIVPCDWKNLQRSHACRSMAMSLCLRIGTAERGIVEPCVVLVTPGRQGLDCNDMKQLSQVQRLGSRIGVG